MKILTIIGARPQIIKASALSRATKNFFKNEIKEVLLHTGQHYDLNMSEVFFNEMGIPQPYYNLNTGSGLHGKQTAAMIDGIENIAMIEKPDCMVVYGDTNSTLAAAIAASKLKIPLAHIEAGLRSFDKTMPEEINRIVADHCSTLLFTPTHSGLNNLTREGFSEDNESPFSINNPGIFHCGDVMFDNTNFFSRLAEKHKTSLSDLINMLANQFLLVTVHRDSNTDAPERLHAILNTINEISIAEKIDVIFPMHPRTRERLKNENELLKQIDKNKLFHIIQPASFFEMILLEKNCSMILTDSGGVQKEAFFLHKPCLVLRPQTEWVELVECGNSILCDADPSLIKNGYRHFSENKNISYPELYGDGHAAEFICKELIRNFGLNG